MDTIAKRQDSYSMFHSMLPEPSICGSKLAEQMASATHRLHNRLNGTIVSQLPHALPPQTRTPERVGRGIAAFATIFFEFERTWERLAREYEQEHEHDCDCGRDDGTSEYASLEDRYTDDDDDDGQQQKQQQQQQLCRHRRHEEVRRWVSGLYNACLSRTGRFEQDIAHLNRRTRSRVDRPLPGQEAMLERIRASTRENVHVLVAYGWVMYMAVFFGGRWIRGQFRDAGEEFWMGETQTPQPSQRRRRRLLPLLLLLRRRRESCDDTRDDDDDGDDAALLEKRAGFAGLDDSPGFSFLSFDGDRDGEDLRREFVEKLERGEDLLTERERGDVVDAAVEVFEMCIQLVDSLERAIWWDQLLRRLGVALVACVLVLCLVLWLLTLRFHLGV